MLEFLSALIPTAAVTGFLGIVGIGAWITLRTGKPLKFRKEESTHALLENRADRLEEIREIAAKINTEVWNRIEHPLTESSLTQEGKSITLECSTSLFVLADQMDVLRSVVDNCKDKGATSQSFDEMMRKGADINIYPVDSRRRKNRLSAAEAAETANTIESVRNNIEQLDSHLKEAYEILGIDIKVDAWDAIQKKGVPSFEDWVGAILEDYPKTISDIIQNNGLEEARSVLSTLKETGKLQLTGRQKKSSKEEIKAAGLGDEAARRNRNLESGAVHGEKPRARL
ncbi:MAG: hypothetical protein M0026_10140 [Nocardiopsaceae bacterium]|nr:hypothetical protein [Nocardiopsaceae bacterium]